MQPRRFYFPVLIDLVTFHQYSATMWNFGQKANAPSLTSSDVLPFARPLPKAGHSALSALDVGKLIHFSAQCPLSPLTGAQATIIAVRQYRFGNDVLENFQLQIGAYKHFFLTVAEDSQGQYLGLSRALSAAEQDRWFGRDALSFFTEPSTAKTIRCKVDRAVEGDWAAERYVKTVDWIEGFVSAANSGKAVRALHYNLLVNESGTHAVEIERDDESGETRVFVTVYRPVEDIARVSDATPARAPAAAGASRPLPFAVNEPQETGEPPLFLETLPPTSPKQRPDFRRVAPDEPPQIRITRTAEKSALAASAPEDAALPSFLTARDGNYMALDTAHAHEPERLRLGLRAARNLIERALSRNVRVRDVLREALGLDSALSDEVSFEFPLSPEDYQLLAARYRLRAEERAEIRARLEEELRALMLR